MVVIAEGQGYSKSKPEFEKEMNFWMLEYEGSQVYVTQKEEFTFDLRVRVEKGQKEVKLTLAAPSHHPLTTSPTFNMDIGGLKKR